MPKKKRADVPAIRPQFDALYDSADDPVGDPFDGSYPPVRRGPAWELTVIESAVEEFDRKNPGRKDPWA